MDNTNSLLTPSMATGVDLKMILRILRYWSWLLVLGALVGSAGGYGVSIQAVPIYGASLLMLIEETRPLVIGNNPDLSAGERTNTYLELISQGVMLEAVAKQLKTDTQQLAASITDIRVERLHDTQLFQITVEGYFPEHVAAVANALPRVLNNEMNNVRSERFAESKTNLANQRDAIKAQLDMTHVDIDRIGVPRTPQEENQLKDLQTILAQYQTSYANLVQSYENLRMVELQTQDNIAIVRSAPIPDSPIRSNTLPNILLGLIVGVSLSLVTILLIEYFDDYIRSPQTLQQVLNTTFLGGIDLIPATKPERMLITATEPRHPIAEAYRAIRTNLRFTSIDTDLHTLLITSPNPGEGKSITAANLAIVMAQLGLSVVLIDGDLRKPRQHKLFQLPKAPGLSETLIQANSSPWEMASEVNIPNLRVLSSGKTPPNPAELMGSRRMRQIIEQLHEQAAVVIFDTPPLLDVSDTAILATHVEAAVMVVNAKRTQYSAAIRAMETLHKVGAHLHGVILNEFSRSSRGYYYYQNDYSYGDYQSAED